MQVLLRRPQASAGKGQGQEEAGTPLVYAASWWNADAAEKFLQVSSTAARLGKTNGLLGLSGLAWDQCNCSISALSESEACLLCVAATGMISTESTRSLCDSSDLRTGCSWL